MKKNLLTWEVYESTADYDDEALAKKGHTVEMQPADLAVPQVHIRFTKAGAERFAELKGITFQRVEKGQMKSVMEESWKLASDFIGVAKEIFYGNYTYYAGTGELVDKDKIRHPVLALMIPIGNYEDENAARHFALVIVNLEYAPPQPVAVAEDDLEGVQGGVIHGPG